MNFLGFVICGSKHATHCVMVEFKVKDDFKRNQYDYGQLVDSNRYATAYEHV